jgi:hypothetical protein
LNGDVWNSSKLEPRAKLYGLALKGGQWQQVHWLTYHDEESNKGARAVAAVRSFIQRYQNNHSAQQHLTVCGVTIPWISRLEPDWNKVQC